MWTVSHRESAITKGMTMLVTLFNVSPVKPMNPLVAPTQTEMLSSATIVNGTLRKKNQIVKVIRQYVIGTKTAISAFMYWLNVKLMMVSPAKKN